MSILLSLTYIIILAALGWFLISAARKKGPDTQKKLALVCLGIGFACIPLEIVLIAIAVSVPEPESLPVLGGEFIYWYMAWRIRKMTGAAGSRAFELAGQNRQDAEAAQVYEACLKDDPSPPGPILAVALQSFRNAGNHAMVITAAERLLRATPHNAQAQSLLVEALTRQGKLKAAEDAARRFAEQTPESAAWMRQALDHLAKAKAESGPVRAERTLADLAAQSPPSSWTPIKVKRYAGQICAGLAQAAASGLPAAVAPEDFALDESNNVRFVLNKNARNRGAFTPPEGELTSAADPNAGLVYGAGRVLMHLVSGGQLAQMPVGWCKSKSHLFPVSPGMMAAEVSCPVCGKSHQPLDASEFPLRSLIANLTSAQEKAIQKAVNPVPGKRFKTPAEFNEALQKS